MTHSASQLTRRFPGKRALVFGAASGLGRETTLLLLDAGWRVMAADIDTARLKADSSLGRALHSGVDVKVADAVQAVVDETVVAFGGVDLVVNSAGIGAGGRFEELPVDVWKEVLDVNVLGTVHGCSAVLPVMRQQKAGHIVNVASAAAFHALPRVSAYNAANNG
ncbi:SDR family oxidoreductase [Streptomyces sp. NPDC001816]|uniref:SDR family oxidoreductase n=1 Tax=Streptomyces sp. NPDC001816 TaxID=3364612 RepID=UPI0036BC39F9